MVLGAAGTGKTRVVQSRFRRLVAQGVAPERIGVLVPTPARAAALAHGWRWRSRLATRSCSCSRRPTSPGFAYGLRAAGWTRSIRCWAAGTGWPCWSSASTSCRASTTTSGVRRTRCSAGSCAGSTVSRPSSSGPTNTRVGQARRPRGPAAERARVRRDLSHPRADARAGRRPRRRGPALRRAALARKQPASPALRRTCWSTMPRSSTSPPARWRWRSGRRELTATGDPFARCGGSGAPARPGWALRGAGGA